MKRHFVTYQPTPPSGPMSWWVRDRPGPALVAGHGYPVFHVEVDGMGFVFASLAELDVCIAVLGAKLLPSGDQLRDGSAGPNAHWVSRLPGFVKPWRFREKAVAYLREARADFTGAAAARSR